MMCRLGSVAGAALTTGLLVLTLVVPTAALCDRSHCSGHGNCAEALGGALQCTCEPGFSGTACETVGGSEKGFAFSVCSKGGGAHGVDFRSHFSVYGAEHAIKGWVRNACNDCVYGMFVGAAKQADELAAILKSPKRVVNELASKAFNVTTTVTPAADAPCDGSLPKEYQDAAVVVVDWSVAKNCSSACGCLPTAYTDCQQTTPLQAGAAYTKDCQRAPLGNTTKNFCDCNSVHVDPETGKACFGIQNGEIVESKLCTGDWAGHTYASKHCCDDPGTAAGGRQGKAIPPAPNKCSAYTTDAGYSNRNKGPGCPSRPEGWTHPLE